jgi:predicted transcriptional regulator
MAGTTVRIPEKTRQTLYALADESGESQQSIVEKAIEAYRRQRILERTSAAYAELRNDPERWRELQEERAEWDDTLSDDLDDE